MRFYYNGNDRNTGAVENDRHIAVQLENGSRSLWHHAAADDLSFCHVVYYEIRKELGSSSTNEAPGEWFSSGASCMLVIVVGGCKKASDMVYCSRRSMVGSPFTGR